MTRRRYRSDDSRGFSLIELMVVIAVIGILAAVAYPSYRSSVIRANRADAQQTLLQAAQRAERYSASNPTPGYAGFAISDTVNRDLLQSPTAGAAVYRLAVQGIPGTTLTIRATPVAPGVNRNDGYLEITDTGARRWDRDNNGSIAGDDERRWSR